MLLVIVIVSFVLSSVAYKIHMDFRNNKKEITCPNCRENFYTTTGWCNTCGHKDKRNFFLAKKADLLFTVVLGVFLFSFGMWSWPKFMNSLWLLLSILGYGAGALCLMAVFGLFSTDKELEARISNIAKQYSPEGLAKIKEEKRKREIEQKKRKEEENKKLRESQKVEASKGKYFKVSNEIKNSTLFKDACNLTLETIEKQLADSSDGTNIFLLEELKSVMQAILRSGSYLLDEPVVGCRGQNKGFSELYYTLQKKGIIFSSSAVSDVNINFSFSKS